MEDLPDTNRKPFTAIHTAKKLCGVNGTSLIADGFSSTRNKRTPPPEGFYEEYDNFFTEFYLGLGDSNGD